ncbi:PREDICTED: proline synthase co-transcribed bacterial homolog protein [Atta cephalotes]|uniref:Pyridoxal phosphate homeostasis protein n=1 Tax=Atta cephalotes TaxID=12957 RepID=A0A158N9P3_ATTCE|nr:PREDICTED: proline synthase co-transcribed bacterial homolog protein [Atta cephalotes]XP_018044001.1 PREDICTED: proline synthase co-transcribed bacterial homolog protein [Atta colombica]
MAIFKYSMAEVAANLKSVCDKISYAVTKRTSEYQYYEPRLVAISKLQSTVSIVSAYEAGQRNFGENYINELVEKAFSPLILEKCKQIRWHFIGHLQRNKINKVLSIPNLYIIETVDSDRLANALNNSWPKFRKRNDSKLNVMIQVNTSQEKEKNGCDIAQVSTLVKHVLENCSNLNFMGLMTIGMYGYDIKDGPNPDFICLIKCREKIHDELGIDVKDIELSMGMSSDYEHAIELGSTNVRVGSAIFGARPQKNNQKDII